jgi:hypothetical protein
LFNGCVTYDQGRLSLGDYKLIETLGMGAFSHVILAAGCNSSKELFALKLVRRQQVSKMEKEVLLQAVNHSFLV